jgi:AcrR family transcriptional regulator
MTQASIPTTPAARRYAGASAQERQAQRRERLLEAALDVFGREGYRNTTMRLICAQARLTERYFYESFATLDEVFTTVHRRLSAEVGQRIMLQVMQASESDPLAQTGAGLRAFFEFIKEDRRRAQILLVDAVTTGLTNPRNLNAKVSQYADLLRDRFRRRYAVLPPDLDIDLVVGGFVGMVIHTATVWADRDFDASIDSLVNHNVYAWGGLHQWLTAHAASEKVPSESPGI